MYELQNHWFEKTWHKALGTFWASAVKHISGLFDKTTVYKNVYQFYNWYNFKPVLNPLILYKVWFSSTGPYNYVTLPL